MRIGVLALIAAAAVAVAYRLGWLDYRHAVSHVENLRRSSNLAAFAGMFLLVYTLATAFGVPGTPLTVAAGVLFGTMNGALLSWMGGLLSSAAGYWIARTVGHDFVTTLIRRNRRVDRAVAESRDFTGMLRLRLLPILPMGVISFVAGLARAPFAPYLAATAIGLAPTCLFFSYFADSLVAGSQAGWRMAIGGVAITSAAVAGATLAPKLLRTRA